MLEVRPTRHGTSRFLPSTQDKPRRIGFILRNSLNEFIEPGHLANRRRSHHKPTFWKLKYNLSVFEVGNLRTKFDILHGLRRSNIQIDLLDDAALIE